MMLLFVVALVALSRAQLTNQLAWIEISALNEIFMAMSALLLYLFRCLLKSVFSVCFQLANTRFA